MRWAICGDSRKYALRGGLCCAYGRRAASLLAMPIRGRLNLAEASAKLVIQSEHRNLELAWSKIR